MPEVEEFLASTSGRLVHRPEDEDGAYWIMMQARGQSGEPFIARLVWTVYPLRPPSLLFADSVGGATNRPASWPSAAGYRAPNDVCKPFTAEGQALHPEWATGPHAWRASGNPFLYVVETVQGDIDRANGQRAA
ncbi:hypothetical protein Lesp02_42170 [Lentzea sp. NBRC 105346]|nr:hypothetical protein Lesp02_42170 [Lentzea sp. NBRC 105346]